MRFLFVLYLFFISFASFSQNLKDLYAEAEKAMLNSNYSNAIIICQDILEAEDHLPQVSKMLADAYRLNLQYELAEKAYEYHITQNKKTTDSYFWLAEMQAIQGKTLLAQKNYNTFIKLQTIDSNERQKAIHELQKVVYSKSNNTNISVIRDTSSPYIQSYGVYFYNGKQLYNGIPIKNDSLTGLASFFSPNIMDSSLFDMLANDKFECTDFTPTYSQDCVIVTVRNVNDSLRLPKRCYISKKNNVWNYPIELDSTQNSNISIHQTLVHANNKNWILYTSNQEGGFGGMDIWIAEVENGIIKQSQNAGPKINTKGDEICPFYNELNKVLYFSSDWHNSIGGFDIFYAEGNFFEWIETKNIGPPINSSYNELYFKIYSDTAYFTSNKEITNFLGQAYHFNKVYKYQIATNNVIEKNSAESPFVANTKKWQKQYFYLYFDNNQPNYTEPRFGVDIKAYVEQKEEYLSLNNEGKIGVSKQVSDNKTRAFFSVQLQQEYLKFSSELDSLCNNNITDTIRITLQAFTSNTGSYEANKQVADLRIESIRNEILYNEILQKKYKNNTLTISVLQHSIHDKVTEYKGFELEAAEQRKVIVTIEIN